VTPGSR